MTERASAWHQGSVLSADAVEALSLRSEVEGKSFNWIVVTHDCDLLNCTKEHMVELIPGIRIDNIASASGYGKNPRLLHIEFSSSENISFVLELDATLKCSVEKKLLNQFNPDPTFKLGGDEYTTLQRWLAARYYRAAFPENFATLIAKTSFKNKRDTLSSRIEQILSNPGSQIRALLFDLDEGALVERGAHSLYRLGIYVLYDSTKNPEAAKIEAQDVANALEDIFYQAFNVNDTWNYIELIYCDAISDNVMTVAQQQNLKQWRLEHLSLSEESIGALLD